MNGYFKPLRRKFGGVTLGLACVFAAGCLVNDPGGGTIHIAPTIVPTGQPFRLELECKAVTGGAERRYKKVCCRYTFDGETIEHELPMTLGKKMPDNKSAVFECTLPGFPKEGELSYLFYFELDGHKNTRWFRTTVGELKK